MATVRPGMFPLTRAPTDARIEELDVDLAEEDLLVDVLEENTKPADVSLAEASILVAGGAGCSAESWHLVEDLAGALGGSVAASRAAVEAGLAPRSRQVGQTGATVSPQLYIACGISGAFQHVVGMQAAKTVVAINRDPEAAIFGFAHFGIIGEIGDVLPRLTTALQEA